MNTTAVTIAASIDITTAVDGPWVGENWLGRLWMELRERGLPR